MPIVTPKVTKIALKVSQCFEDAYPRLTSCVGAFVLRSLDHVPEGSLDRTAHLNGFIDEAFDRECTPDFFKGLRDHNVCLLSFDLGPSCERVRMEDYWLPDSRILSADEILAIGRSRIAKLRSSFSGTLSLENLDYHPGGAYEHVCDPDFIRRALEAFDVGLTLDIGHLNVTCYHTGMSPESYLRRLPLERLSELQVSHAEGGDDQHGVPTENDYALVERILREARPDYVALEYYWDAEKIVEATKRLHTIVLSTQAA